MAEKSKGSSMDPGEKVVSMKLFATWEVEKSSPNCIPRICSLTLVRLVVQKPIESDLNYVIVAVKMQGSKRVLRSNEVCVPSSGTLDVNLDLSFTLQYPHFLKRDGNKLQVMLQRRKRYKNRTILGYKTLAVGQVSMAQVLQHSVDRDLNLYADDKERKTVVAKVTMVALSSQPVDHDEIQNGRRKLTSDMDRSPDVDNDSEDDEVEEDPENWSNDELSDSEPTMLEEDARTRTRKVSRGKVRPIMSRQRNLKQKFVALLKKFKISDEVLDSEADHDLVDPDTNPPDIDDLIDQLEDLSDSEPELDTMSVMSTPKPRLRPFFAGRGSNNEIDRNSLSPENQGRSSDENSSAGLAERDLEPDPADQPASSLEAQAVGEPSKSEVFTFTAPKSVSIDPKVLYRERSTSYKEKKHKKEHRHLERRSSMGYEDQLPRKALLEQLGTVLGGADDKLPDNLLLVNTAEWQGQLLSQKLQDKQLRLICTCSDADVKAAVNFLVSKIQKFCNSNSKSPRAIKMAIAGGDSYINSVLRPYLEQFSAKSPDWQSYVRFMIIPFGVSSVGKFVAMMDNTYAALFMDSQWKDTFEKPEGTKLDSQEIHSRMSKYLSTAQGLVQIPIAEAMVMCKGKSTDEESSQIFVPFLSEVKIGSAEEVLNASVDYEEGLPAPAMLSSSPPMNAAVLDKQRELHTPPNSPNVSNTSMFQGTSPGSGALMPREYVELQVDYWAAVNRLESTDKGDKSSKKDSNKVSLKTAFKSLQVCRLPCTSCQPYADSQSMAFSLSVVTREKKQKIRIGKKSKEGESKSQTIDGISRLICTSKSQNHSLKVVVDGVEWTGVKFFQLSSQWQTHMKHFPIAVFNHTDQPFSSA